MSNNWDLYHVHKHVYMDVWAEIGKSKLATIKLGIISIKAEIMLKNMNSRIPLIPIYSRSLKIIE